MKYFAPAMIMIIGACGTTPASAAPIVIKQTIIADTGSITLVGQRSHIRVKRMGNRHARIGHHRGGSRREHLKHRHDQQGGGNNHRRHHAGQQGQGGNHHQQSGDYSHNNQGGCKKKCGGIDKPRGSHGKWTKHDDHGRKIAKHKKRGRYQFDHHARRDHDKHPGWDKNRQYKSSKGYHAYDTKQKCWKVWNKPHHRDHDQDYGQGGNNQGHEVVEQTNNRSFGGFGVSFTIVNNNEPAEHSEEKEEVAEIIVDTERPLK